MAPHPGEGVRTLKGKSQTPSPAGDARGAVPGTVRGAPKQPLGFSTQSPPLLLPDNPRSFPSSFTYVNDDPQEVIVGERRELASLDLLNHFITGTRSEWPFSAGSASPSLSPFI